MSEILGLNTSLVIVLATITGVGLRIVLGWAKNKEPFMPKKTISTLITGFFTGVVFVGTSLENIQADADSQIQLILVLGSIASVAGIDSLLRTSNKITGVLEGIKKTKK